MAKDIKNPEDYKTAKFTIYLYPRDRRQRRAHHQAGVVNCTNSGRNYQFAKLGQLVDFLTTESSKFEAELMKDPVEAARLRG